MSKKNITILVLSAVIGFFVVLGIKKVPPKAAEVASNASQPTILDEGTPVVGGAYQLIDQNGKTRTDRDFLGKYQLIYFGYSFCPDICPMGLQLMTAALKKVDPASQKFQPIFITIDPERDTVENLSRYATQFHPNFVMLTGSAEAIQKAIKAYRVYAAKYQDPKSTDYLMDHSSLIYVMDPQGKFVAHFNHATPVDELVQGLQRVLTSSKR